MFQLEICEALICFSGELTDKVRIQLGTHDIFEEYSGLL